VTRTSRPGDIQGVKMGIKKLQIFAKFFKKTGIFCKLFQNISKKFNYFRPFLDQYLAFLASFWPFCFHLVFAKNFFSEIWGKGVWTPAFAGVVYREGRGDV
jgi:hypothetical protein